MTLGRFGRAIEALWLAAEPPVRWAATQDPVEHELSEIIAELDQRIPKEGARVRVYQYGGGADESCILATPSGYLRLGVEMLKAAHAPSVNPDYPRVIDVDLGDLLDADSSVYINLFERVDSLETPEPVKLSGFDRIVPVLIFGLFGIAALLLLIGLGTVISWLF